MNSFKDIKPRKIRPANETRVGRIGLKAIYKIIELSIGNNVEKCRLDTICKRAETALLEDGVVAEAMGTIVNDAIEKIKRVVRNNGDEEDMFRLETLRSLRNALSVGCLQSHYQDWMNPNDDPDFFVFYHDFLPCLTDAILFFAPAGTLLVKK